MKEFIGELICYLKVAIIKISRSMDSFIRSCFYILPVDHNCIVLESEGDYSDSIRVFYDYLIKNKYNNKYKIVWLVHSPGRYKKEKNVIFTSRFGAGIHFRADYYTAVCGYFIFSHPHWLTSWRKDQCVIHTTHSVAQLKARGEGVVPALCDYVLCCSDYCAKIKCQTINIAYDHILPLGIPRLDLLFEDSRRSISKLVYRYHGQKIILSMETFKQAKDWSDSVAVDAYAINVIHNPEEMKKLNHFLFINNCILVVKIHHMQDLSYITEMEFENIIYLKDDQLLRADIQVNQLLQCADVLLTDYSSVFYDYLVLDRPIGFLIGDWERYTRGFFMDNPFEEMPGAKIRDLNELMQFLYNAINGMDNFEEERYFIRKKVFKYQDNCNCERLLQWIEERNERMN